MTSVGESTLHWKAFSKKQENPTGETPQAKEVTRSRKGTDIRPEKPRKVAMDRVF